LSERDVIKQIDALINRHRPTSDNQPPSETAEHPSMEEDVPVLTEVVDAHTGDITTLVPSMPDTQAAMRAALARELEVWLDEKLPDAVLRVLDGLSDQLIAQVAAQARLELLPRLKNALETRSKHE
jgi:uncharacterized FlaG/YvyC family protein